MTNSRRNDPVWRAAVVWVLRAQEHPLDADAMAALTAWLDQDLPIAPPTRKQHVCGCSPG